MNAPLLGHNSPPLADRLAIEEAPLLAEAEAIAARANALPRRIRPESPDTDLAEMGAVIRDAQALARRAEARRVAVKGPILEAEKTIDGFFREKFAQRMGNIAVAFNRLVEAWREERRQEAARKAAEEERQRRAEALERARAAEEAARKGRERTAALEAQKAAEAAKEADRAREAAQAAAAPAVAPTKAEVAPDLTMATKSEWQGRVLDRAGFDYAVIGPYLRPQDVEDALKRAVKAGVRSCRGAEIKLVEKVDFR